jgi:hypothetical protein
VSEQLRLWLSLACELPKLPWNCRPQIQAVAILATQPAESGNLQFNRFKSIPSWKEVDSPAAALIVADGQQLGQAVLQFIVVDMLQDFMIRLCRKEHCRIATEENAAGQCLADR